MNIGLSTVGISHPTFGGIIRRCDKCEKNTMEMVVEPLSKIGNLKTYVTTYEHENINRVMSFYNPTRYSLTSIVGSNLIDTYLTSLRLLLGEDIDLVVSTRFDILFKNPLSEIAFNYKKFNTLFMESGWERYNFTCDNLFVFPYSMLELVINSLETWKVVKPGGYGSPIYGLHGLWHQVNLAAGSSEVHVVLREEQRILENKFYQINHFVSEKN